MGERALPFNISTRKFYKFYNREKKITGNHYLKDKPHFKNWKKMGIGGSWNHNPSLFIFRKLYSSLNGR